MDGSDTYSDVSGVHGAIREEAHAKVNLTLEVIGKRGDGYHNIVSIIQTIDIHDVLTIESAPELSVTCDDPELPGESNLALLAAEALCHYIGERRGALIHVSKNIPVAAGLGGGSADAAAALRALNRLWEPVCLTVSYRTSRPVSDRTFRFWSTAARPLCRAGERM